MTTQLSLFNMFGIAVASDTLSSLRTSAGFKHSFGNSKIWTPQSGHNFVVYHSGSVNFNSMPHQLHVEAWFRTLNKPLATLNDYAESYKRFSASKSSPHHPASELNLLKSLLLDLVNLMRRHIDEAQPVEDWNQLVITEAEEALEYYNSIGNFKKTSLTWVEETLALHKFNIKKELKEIFPEKLPVRFQNLVVKCFKKFLITTCTTDFDSSLTFAGYGEKDLYPTVNKIDFRGILNGKLLAEPNITQAIEPTVKTSGILYGAQTDAIWGLVQGFRSPVRSHLNRILGDYMPEADDKQDKIDKAIEDLTQATWNDYVDPFFRRLGSSSLPELADSARDLINVQLISAKLSGFQETVGGTVEVLTIDKTNGIRWQSRI